MELSNEGPIDQFRLVGCGEEEWAMILSVFIRVVCRIEELILGTITVKKQFEVYGILHNPQI